jgi:hypothetical protein
MQHYAWINIQMKQEGHDSVDTPVEELDQVISGSEAQCLGCHRYMSTVSELLQTTFPDEAICNVQHLQIK